MNNSTTWSRRLFGTVGALALACAGCAVEEPSRNPLDETKINSIKQSITEDDVVSDTENINCDDVTVTVIETGDEEYIIHAQTFIDRPVGDIWPEIRDFEQLVDIGLPGLATNFQWLNGGGPEQIPSTFQFESGGATVVEEIYYRSEYKHKLRYRVVEPALGIIEYDAVLNLDPVWFDKTYYSATRVLTLEPGVVDGLTALIELETQNIKAYFESSSATLDADPAAE